MFDALATLLGAFYALIPNYAVAIALLTIVVMLVLSPFTWKSTRSMIALQRLQPEIKRLQEQHKGDRQALNEAMMAFYQEHKINPLSSCLPMLLQMPVLIVMFQVIRGLTHSGGPKYIPKDFSLYQDLKDAGGDMVALGINLAESASQTTGSDAIPLYALIALVVATSFWQTRQMTARNPQAAANPQTRIMQRVFPLLSGFISLSLPGGVVLYFLVSNLFRIAQQALLYRFDPTLAATVRKEVREVEAKAEEIKHRPAKTSSPAPARRASAPPVSGRVTPKATPSRRPGSRRSRRRARGR